jgi:hypothetical protein
MILSQTVKPKADAEARKLRHILADQVKPKVFDFDRNRYKETNPKRKPGGPLMTSHLGDIAAMKKRAEVAAIPDVVKAKRTKMDVVADAAGAARKAMDKDIYQTVEHAFDKVAESILQKKGSRPKKAK